MAQNNEYLSTTSVVIGYKPYKGVGYRSRLIRINKIHQFAMPSFDK